MLDSSQRNRTYHFYEKIRSERWNSEFIFFENAKSLGFYFFNGGTPLFSKQLLRDLSFSESKTNGPSLSVHKPYIIKKSQLIDKADTYQSTELRRHGQLACWLVVGR